ncbi:uncharacterized protein LOC143370211 [Andrena cerasifolii]|uniref:uncharacterized protein LOC143370211 n=1 Tax=Andrena cerasifolii TaxID=2819439 RepID=UPI004037FA2B
MPGEKRNNQRRGRRSYVSSPFRSTSSTPASQQKRFKAKSAPNSNGQASTFKSAAGTAAGVAVGSVLGQVIGSKLVGRASSANAESRDSAEMQELCVPEIREFFECASTTENLDTCKAFHNTWMKCQNKYKHCEN